MKRKKEKDKRERHAAAKLTESLKIFMQEGGKGEKPPAEKAEKKKTEYEKKKDKKKGE